MESQHIDNVSLMAEQYILVTADMPKMKEYNGKFMELKGETEIPDIYHLMVYIAISNEFETWMSVCVNKFIEVLDSEKFKESGVIYHNTTYNTFTYIDRILGVPNGSLEEIIIRINKLHNHLVEISGRLKEGDLDMGTVMFELKQHLDAKQFGA